MQGLHVTFSYWEHLHPPGSYWRVVLAIELLLTMMCSSHWRHDSPFCLQLLPPPFASLHVIILNVVKPSYIHGQVQPFHLYSKEDFFIFCQSWLTLKTIKEHWVNYGLVNFLFSIVSDFLIAQHPSDLMPFQPLIVKQIYKCIV